MGRRSFPSSAHEGKPRTWCARWRFARAPPSPGEVPFLETLEVADEREAHKALLRANPAPIIVKPP
jgi:hypothetical protein